MANKSVFGSFLSRNEEVRRILFEDGPMPGRELREKMNQGKRWWYRLCNNRPSFYLLMAKMEGDGLVEAWNQNIVVEGETIQQRWFRLKR